MVGAADVAIYTASLLALTLLVAGALRYELGRGTFVSSLTAISVTSAGLMVALCLQIGLEIPFVWSLAALAAMVLLFVTLYELFSRRRGTQPLQEQELYEQLFL